MTIYIPLAKHPIFGCISRWSSRCTYTWTAPGEHVVMKLVHKHGQLATLEIMDQFYFEFLLQSEGEEEKNLNSEKSSEVTNKQPETEHNKNLETGIGEMRENNLNCKKKKNVKRVPMFPKQKKKNLSLLIPVFSVDPQPDIKYVEISRVTRMFKISK